MINIDKVGFESIVSAAACASTQVFDAMQDALDQAQKRAFYDVVPKAIVEAEGGDLEKEMTRYICLDAFYRQIPQLDLVLTPTGFGVVSNQNVAPASRDRVQALQENIRNERDDSLERMIRLLLGNADWAGSFRAMLLVPSVIFLSDHLREYAGIDGHMTDLLGYRAKINEVELRIMNICSSEQYETILMHIRANTLSEAERKIILLMRRAIGFYLNSLWGGLERELQNISNYLEENLDEFGDYASSQAYKVKHFVPYENESNDSTYFFG
jgi:hypothetical protein